MKCPNCGTEVEKGVFCINCGKSLQKEEQVREKIIEKVPVKSANYSAMPIIAMILGIVGFVLSCTCVGIIPSLCGLILAIIVLIKGNGKKVHVIIALMSSVLGIILAIIVGIIGLGSLDDKANETHSEEQVETSSFENLEIDNSDTAIYEDEKQKKVKVLGTDLSIYDLSFAEDQDKIEFVGRYWAKRDDGLYIFMYKENDDNGNISKVNIFVADETEEKSLSVLDNVSYEENEVVRIVGVFEKSVILDDGAVQFYFTAEEVSIVDPNSMEAKKIIGNYYYVGDSIHLSNDVNYHILDAGKYEEFTGVYAYVDIEIENLGAENYNTYAANAQFYGDGYQLTMGMPGTDENAFLSCDLSKGRKAKGRFYAQCPNYDQMETIEVEFADIEGVTVVIKDESADDIEQGENKYLDLWNCHTLYMREDGTYLEIYPVDDTSFFLAIRDYDGLDLRDLRFEIAESGVDAQCLDEGYNLEISVSSDGNYINIIQVGDIPYYEGMNFSGTYEGFSETPE